MHFFLMQKNLTWLNIMSFWKLYLKNRENWASIVHETRPAGIFIMLFL